MIQLSAAASSSSSRELYQCSHRLPSEQDANRVLELLRKKSPSSGGSGPNVSSSSGCARAEQVQPLDFEDQAAPRKVLTRILAKVVDAVPTKAHRGEVEDERDPLDDEDEEEANLRDGEYNRLRYHEMSLAYLRNPNAKLEVRKSAIHGWGLFALVNFEKNDVIVEYIGQKIRQVVADRRETLYEQEGVGSCYLFRLDKEDIIDATRTGGMARFINHCCEPNAFAKVISTDASSLQIFKNCNAGLAVGSDMVDLDQAGKHITIMAARDIQEGEEITYDYKFPIEEKKLRCYCGARSCQGSMN